MKALLPLCALNILLAFVIVPPSEAANLIEITPTARDRCAELLGVSLPHTVITGVQYYSGGQYEKKELGFSIEYAESSLKTKAQSMPAFCRVNAVSVPTDDSHIKIEIWLPAKKWNGRYYQFGMGGAAGSIDRAALRLRLRTGAAIATTDTGHTSRMGEFDWALGRPEKVIDYGYRAHKETSDIAKALVQQYYDRQHDYAYFFGCSRGGHAGLVSARRYPDDWDGIMIGAAPSDLSTHFSFGLWLRYYQDLLHPDSHIQTSKIPAIQRAALAACGPAAQLVRGVAGDPRHCRYDPSILLCQGEETDDCLTAPQVQTLSLYYNGAVGPHSGKNGLTIQPTMEVGEKITAAHKAMYEKNIGKMPTQVGDYGWVGNVFGSPIVESYFRSVVLNDRDWSISDIDQDDIWSLAKDKMVSGEALEDVLDGSVNWKKFGQSNGKMIMYHGWGDGTSGIEMYEEAVSDIGGDEKTQEHFRLFMVPGMGHCSGGPGAHDFGVWSPGLKDDASHNIYRALEAWVEDGVAPESIIAAKFIDDQQDKGVAFTRPLCVYPKVRKYKGVGDINDADSFECKTGAAPPQ